MWIEDNGKRPSPRPNRHLVIDDEVIHAFIDDMLPPRQRLEVDEYLAANPEQARRVSEIQDQNRQFHVLFDGSLNQRLPKRLQDLSDDICRKLGRRSRNRKVARSMAKAAYASILIVAGVAVGWFAPLPSIAPDDLMRLAPIETSGRLETESVAATRLANVLANGDSVMPATAGDRPVRPVWAKPPDLGAHGFRLASTRIIKNGTPQETAQLVYDTESGDQVILYLARNAREDSKQVTMTHEGAVSILVWKDKGRSYTMVSEVGRDRMMTLGKSISSAMVPSFE